MYGRSGLQLLREARSKRRDLPVVVVTRDGDWNGYAHALDAGASDYIPHPINRRQLVTAVAEALAQAT
jgi:two-component system response regulator PhoP